MSTTVVVDVDVFVAVLVDEAAFVVPPLETLPLVVEEVDPELPISSVAAEPLLPPASVAAASVSSVAAV